MPSSAIVSDNEPLSRSLVTLFAVGAGLCAASLYYNQPILGPMAQALDTTPAKIGFVPMLTQLGYGAGILLFAPLGDRLERRRVIVSKLVLLALALTVAGLSRSLEVMAAASLTIGLFATAAQDFVPAAAACAPPTERGKIVGSVMTGLLLGILLSRLVSGATSDRVGWRAVYFVAAATITLLAIVSAARLPTLPPTVTDPWGALFRSMATLVRDMPDLRRAALAQALLSVAFSAFWSTLALALAAPPYRLGSTVAGMFGLAGAAGAAAAPLAGAIADKKGPEGVLRWSATLVVVAFLAMAALPGSLALLVIGTVLFDLGVQACLIAHQAIVYGLDPAARSRLNAVLISSMFLGMSTGAALGSQVLARFGWRGVTLLGAGAALLALLVRLSAKRAVRDRTPREGEARPR